jgi:primosomal protein N' (replication factor Y) (superfamily II helicase)
MFVQVAVNIPTISGVFDYHLPAELAGKVQPGCLVVVPFGRQVVQGVVLRLVAEAQVQMTRPVEALLDPLPVLTPDQLKLAHQMAQETLAPLAACIDVMLPPGLSQQADRLYHRNDPIPAQPGLPTTQQKILDLLAGRGDLRGRQLEALLPHLHVKEALLALSRRGFVVSHAVLPPPGVRPKVVRTAQLMLPQEEAIQRLAELGRESTFDRRKALVNFLAKETLPVQVSWAYAASGANLADLEKLADAGLVALGESEVWRDPLEGMEIAPHDPPPLTPEQGAAMQVLRAELQSAARGKPVQPVLLHGVTGSGKTELYLQAVAETLRLGRQAIVLVPEIALTPQTVRRFLARFPGQVGLVHSSLSPGERFDTWRRARSGQLPVIVGPRSALFTPLSNLGLIVVDECHDGSYYNNETMPYYHSIPVAQEYARLTNSVVLYGSATPDVDLIYQAEREHWSVLRLPERVLAHRTLVGARMAQLGAPLPALAVEGQATVLPLPPVKLVDMREELKSGNRSIFSKDLQQALQVTLAAHQQAILFLNRRGAATYVFCRQCGESVRCPRCDLPLTYHLDEDALMCHTCNYRRKVPQTCPKCGSSAIRQYGMGIEKVEVDLQAMLPEARILRYDADTTRTKGAHDILLAHFYNHRADIMIGTQMLSKGLDLPLVTLVGIILADVGLNFPDYRAGERAFQVLTQVAGRSGRSPLGGQVIMQTFQPENYAVQAAAHHDYTGFYQQELENRRRIGYPPFAKLARLEYRARESGMAEEKAVNLAEQLKLWIEQGGFHATELVGPVPCYFAKVSGEYRWQILVRGPDPAALLRGKPLGEWRVEINPLSVL